MTKAIIFDFGGVVGTPENFEKLREKYSKLFGISPDELRPVFRKNWMLWKTNKINEKKFWDNISNELKFKYNLKQVKKVGRNMFKVDNNIVSLAKELKNKYKIYILSNHSKEWFNHITTKYNLNELFEGIFTSYEAKSAKPEKEIYLKFLKKFNLKSEECIFIDNRQDNIKTSKELGFKGIFFENFKQLKKELIKLGVN